MKNKVSIHWFRQDLRIQDNPSLSYLTKNSDNIVCVFVLDEINCDRIIGSASKVWLYNALKDLKFLGIGATSLGRSIEIKKSKNILKTK